MQRIRDLTKQLRNGKVAIDEFFRKSKKVNPLEKWKPPSCWKDTYIRKTVPSNSCASGQQKILGKCYHQCKSGFSPAVGLLCKASGSLMKRCPVSCGWRTWSKCNGCPTNYFSSGLCTCTTTSYTRSSTSMSCGSGAEKFGPFCYPKCRTGMHAVANVCWDRCPAGFTNCGAFCAESKTVCKIEIFDAVLNTGIFGLQIACIAVTAGACSAIQSPRIAFAAKKYADIAGDIQMWRGIAEGLYGLGQFERSVYQSILGFISALLAAIAIQVVLVYDTSGFLTVIHTLAKPLCSKLEEDSVIWSIIKVGGF